VAEAAGLVTARYEADCEGWAYETCTQKAAIRVREFKWDGHWHESLHCYLHVHRIIDGWIYETAPPNYRVFELLDK
jgi:hypothetical protein